MAELIAEQPERDPTPTDVRALIAKLREPTLGMMSAHLGLAVDDVWDSGVRQPEMTENVLRIVKQSLARVADYLEANLP